MLIICERKDCGNFFDNKDHRFQRFCSKRCAKLGTKLRHQGLVDDLDELAIETSLLLVATGLSFAKASALTGVNKSTIFNHYKRHLKKLEKS